MPVYLRTLCTAHDKRVSAAPMRCHLLAYISRLPPCARRATVRDRRYHYKCIGMTVAIAERLEKLNQPYMCKGCTAPPRKNKKGKSAALAKVARTPAGKKAGVKARPLSNAALIKKYERRFGLKIIPFRHMCEKAELTPPQIKVLGVARRKVKNSGYSRISRKRARDVSCPSAVAEEAGKKAARKAPWPCRERPSQRRKTSAESSSSQVAKSGRRVSSPKANGGHKTGSQNKAKGKHKSASQHAKGQEKTRAAATSVPQSRGVGRVVATGTKRQPKGYVRVEVTDECDFWESESAGPRS